MKVKDYYVDKTEILNIHWVEYVRVQSKDLDSLEIRKLLPANGNSTFALPENQYKPVVFITYEQALDYCKWRSEVVSKRSNKNITYRLPTSQEWTAIAQELLASRQAEKEIKETRKLMAKRDGSYVLFENSNPKDVVSHLFNNVSEMTLKKGVAMGLNNYDLYKQSNSSAVTPEESLKTFNYTSPHPYLGFRCVAVVEK